MGLFKSFLLTLTIFLGFDFFWLTVVAKNFYAKHLGFLIKNPPDLVAALVFYLLFVIGLLFLVLIPSLEKQSVNRALLLGALFGLVCYATYDLTNLATIKNWPLIITIIDLIWGTTLSATVSTIAYLLIKKLNLI